MKILFSTDQTYLHGGIEKVMSIKANYFADVLEYDVTILTIEQRNKKSVYALNEKIKKIDLSINYNRATSYFHPKNFTKIPLHFFRWYKTIKQQKPDAIITCNDSFDFYWIPFFFPKIKKIREYHSSRCFRDEQRANSTFFKKIFFKFNDFIESKYDTIVVLTDDELKHYHSKNTVVIPNPVLLSRIKSSLNNHKVIAAGRIASVKGFEEMIAIWKLVVQQIPDWELHIYGDGDENYIQDLNKLITDSNLEKNITIKSAVENLASIMQEYSMYLMTSKTECFPMVLLESLSVGLPVVSYDCPYGPKNIIKNGEDGFLIENKNQIEFANKVIELSKNANLLNKFGENAKQNVIRFSEKIIMNKWVEILN